MKTVLFSALICWLAIGNSFGEPSDPSANEGSTNLLSVQIWPSLRNEVFHAPATIHINAYVSQHAQAQAGEVVWVKFFANTNTLLGSAKCVWHDTIRPHPHPGQAMPMYIIAPGFPPASLVWSNAPAGDYTLTAQATCTNGLSGASAPVKVDVLP